MRRTSAPTVFKAFTFLLTVSALVVTGHAASAAAIPGPIHRRPTPTLPPLPSKPISIAGDETFSQIENEMRLQSDDVSLIEVASAAAQFLAQTGSTLNMDQMNQLLALASTDEARNEILVQFKAP